MAGFGVTTQGLWFGPGFNGDAASTRKVKDSVGYLGFA